MVKISSAAAVVELSSPCVYVPHKPLPGLIEDLHIVTYMTADATSSVERGSPRQIARMSNRKRTPSKRQSDFTDCNRSGGHPPPFPYLVTSQSPEESLSPQNSHEQRLANAPDRQPLFTSQPGPSLENVLTQSEVPRRASTTSRVLPSLSPTGSTLHALPPISLPSPRHLLYTPHHAGRASEHETNDTAIQTLQRENSDLISAYSSAQIRIADLDEAAQASNLERAKLAKDRQRLEAKIDVLEAEVDELQNSIEVSQRHTAAKDAQYSYIVEMSTRLETQSASDSQQWKIEQKQWACEKRDMQDTIGKRRPELRNLQTGLSKPTASHTDKPGYRSEASSRSTPRATDQASLEQRFKSLQYANASMEAVLIGVRKEQVQLTEYVEKLGGIGKNIQTRLQSVGAIDSVSRTMDGE